MSPHQVAEDPIEAEVEADLDLGADAGPPASLRTPAAPRTGWEFVEQVQGFARQARRVVAVLVVVLALMVLGQVLLYYDLFARTLHPAAGVAWLLAVGALGWLLVGLPMLRYMRMPAVVRPPNVDLDRTDLTPVELARRAAYVGHYLAAMQTNPELTSQWEDVRAARTRQALLWGRIRAAKPAEVPALKAELIAFEHDLERLLAPLDRKVDAYVRKEALAVAVATAASQNGTIDAFIVLWRHVNMVSRISRYYYGRPNLAGSLRVLVDVSAAVVTGRVADDVTDIASGLLVGTLGNIGGAVTGTLMDGTVNGLMTLRVGYLAKGRCRGFSPWSERRIAGVLAGSSRFVREQSGWLVKSLARRFGVLGERAGRIATAVAQTSRAAATTAAEKGRSAWKSVLGRFGTRGTNTADLGG